MKRLLISTLCVFALTVTAAEDAITPRERAARNRELLKTYSPSVTTVRYYLKKNAAGEEAKLKVPYVCPNCGGTHYHDETSDPAKKIPLEIAGFVVGDRRVIVQDILVPPEFIDRVAVVTPSGEVTATEFERSPANNALALKAEGELKGLKPLVFTGKEPKAPKYFYIASEDGLTKCGVRESNIASFAHYVEPNRDIYAGNQNTVVIDDDDSAVTLAMKGPLDIGDESFVSPAEWKWEPAEAYHERMKSRQAKIAKGVFPVYIQLEAKAKEERETHIYVGDSSNINDIDTTGVALESGKVLVFCVLTSEATARLQRLEATLPDGSKHELRFVGSLKDFGGIIAEFADEAAVEPLRFDRRAAVEHFGERALALLAINRGGRLDFKTTVVECRGLKRVENNESVAEFREYAGVSVDYDDRRTSNPFIVGEDGRIIAMTLSDRQGRYRSFEPVLGSRLYALADAPVFDPESIPRKAEDRRRVAWFGVDVQPAGADVVREKKAASYLGRWVERAPLVTEVATNSPAAAAGVKAGDILISASRVGADDGDSEALSVDSDYASRIDWSEIFGSSMFVDASLLRGATPWPSFEGGINRIFAQFGVGAEIEVTWVRDGVRMSGKCRLALAPVHFENAPRKRSKELGVTVCDLTDEVRKYFKLESDAPGVVVVKMKSGGVAAVSGLKPLELITEVDGAGVKDAKDFVERVKDVKKCTLSVRRLTATRVVPISF